jgi:hypothetical protein
MVLNQQRDTALAHFSVFSSSVSQAAALALAEVAGGVDVTFCTSSSSFSLTFAIALNVLPFTLLSLEEDVFVLVRAALYFY